MADLRLISQLLKRILCFQIFKVEAISKFCSLNLRCRTTGVHGGRYPLALAKFRSLFCYCFALFLGVLPSLPFPFSGGGPDAVGTGLVERTILTWTVYVNAPISPLQLPPDRPRNTLANCFHFFNLLNLGTYVP